MHNRPTPIADGIIRFGILVLWCFVLAGALTWEPGPDAPLSAPIREAGR